MSDEKTSKLRVGLLLNSMELPAWALGLARTIQQSSYARVELAVVRKPPAAPPKRPLLARRPWEGLLYRVICAADDRRKPPTTDAFAPCDASELLSGVPVLAAQPVCDKFSDRLSESDLAAVGSYDLDVLVRLGWRILRGGILQAARCGVWSFHHGDNRVNRGGPPGFWEVYEGHPVTGSILQILSEELDGGLVLARSYSATDPISVRINRNNYYWKTSLLLPRKLRELHETGAERFMARAREENRHPELYSRRLYRKPGNAACARFILRVGGRYLRENLRKGLWRQQWSLLWSMQEGLDGSLERYRRLIPPRDRFWADPHIVRRDGLYYLFVEEFMYATDKAHVALIVLDEHGRTEYRGKVLDRPYHISYPHVLEHGGELYMVPELRRNRTVELYRCVEFPHRWEHELDLMRGIDAVDCTLLQRGGRWWMFANVAEVAGASTWDELFLFQADTLLTQQWRPHRGNPLISDVRRSRPAGALFTHNGGLYRPFQDRLARIWGRNGPGRSAAPGRGGLRRTRGQPPGPRVGQQDRGHSHAGTLRQTDRAGREYPALAVWLDASRERPGHSSRIACPARVRALGL